jgi:ParB family chromosome partitioning protein
MNAQPDLIRIPLGQLQLSPRNARKTGGDDVEGLAASIAAHGLLQNLTVQPSDNDDAPYGVVAGGRRLAALQLLAKRNELPAALSGDGIPCRLIVDDDVALEASTAENTLREAMHPADQFDAFHAMIESGKPLADVAAHFGVEEIVVKQRLKLANVNPELVQIYRNDGMSLEQLQALAITDNHEAQRQAWFTAQHDWERSPRDLREKLTRREARADDTLAKFVGLDAYEAAGGSVRRDLFSTRGDAWLQDKPLLDRLALDKLEALAQAERDAGWSWAEAHLAFDYAKLSDYQIHPAMRDAKFSGEQQQRLDEIEERIEQLEMDGDESLSEEEFDVEMQRLELEREEIHAAAQPDVSDDVRATTGVLVFLDYDGVRIERGRLKPGQKVDNAGAITGKPKETAKTAEGGATAAKPKKPELSAAILNVLSAHRSEVARSHVARDPHLALALLVDYLASAVKHDWGHADVLHLTGLTVPDARKAAPDIHAALPDPAKDAAEGLKQLPRKDRLSWLLQRNQAELLAMLAACVAARFGGLSDRPDGHAGVATLHAAIGFDMADHWNAGCDNFLGRIPAALVLEAVTEAKGKDVAATLNGLRKDELIAQAAKLLAGTGWLPKPLRGPGYTLKGAKPAATAKPAPKAKPAKPAKKASAKKPVAKKASSKKAAKKSAAKVARR